MVTELIRNIVNYIFIFLDQHFIIFFTDFIMKHIFNCIAKINIVARNSEFEVKILGLASSPANYQPRPWVKKIS